MSSLPSTYPIETVRALSQQIAADALQNNPHAVVLDALLTAFATVAHAYPCCTLQVGKMAVHIGDQLMSMATEKPANASVH